MDDPCLTKADLQALVDSLPDDPDDPNSRHWRDIGEVVRWMASPARHYSQSVTNHEGRICEMGRVVEGRYGPPRLTHYFLVFDPKGRK